MSKVKILIAGIGGVGGYFGGLLAKRYSESESVEIHFLSRGENLDQINSKGLQVFDDNEEFVAHPETASDRAEDFGVVDYVLFCTKSYSLVEVAKQLKPCVDERTVLVPIQNGVNSRNVLSESYPRNLITDGCVFLVSRIEKPGVIVSKGKVAAFNFGLDGVEDARLDRLQEVLVEAGINSKLLPEVSVVVWEKYIFLSSIATANSYFDINIEEILSDENKREKLVRLVEEVTGLARFNNVNVRGGQVDRVLKILASLPAGATTSMHSDFKSGKGKTELESLTGYVVRECKSNELNFEVFEEMYNFLK